MDTTQMQNFVQDIELANGAVRLPVRIYQPETTGRIPAVIVASGGMTRGSIPMYAWIAERFAAAGYFVISLTYRADNPFDDPLDINLALAQLDQYPQIDRERLFIFGHSRGGLSALRAAAQEPRLRAVVSMAAPIDLTHYATTTATYCPTRHAQVVQWMGGTPEQIPERYAVLRGLNYAEQIKQPVLLIHGTLDMITPIDYTFWMEQALREAGNMQVRVEIIPGIGHFCEMTTAGYQFDKVAELVLVWLAQFT